MYSVPIQTRISSVQNLESILPHGDADVAPDSYPSAMEVWLPVMLCGALMAAGRWT
jgi:hypothetical protein